MLYPRICVKYPWFCVKFQDIMSNYTYSTSNYMSNNLTSNHQISINFHFYFFQTATMWIFKGDFPFLHFFILSKNWKFTHQKRLGPVGNTFLVINKICCFLKKGGMSRRQNGICFGTFFKKGSKLQNSAVSLWLVVDWLSSQPEALTTNTKSIQPCLSKSIPSI